MPSSITHVAVVRPSGRLGPLAVEAPDEDGFTLAVAAVEALAAPSPGSVLGRIDMVGDVPADAEWALPEALGITGAAVHRSPGGPSHLFEALRASPEDPGSGTRLVVAVDRAHLHRGSGPSHGALALAFRLGGGPGIEIEDVATHVPSPARAHGGLRLESRPTGVRGEPVPLLLLGEDVRVAEAARSVGTLGYSPAVVPRSPPGTGPAPTAPFGLALRAVPHSGTEAGQFMLVVLGPERDVYVSARTGGPVVWSEPTPSPPVPLSAPPAGDDPRILDARAEGAYVPRARYLENLPSRWRLVGERCGACEKLTFPARGACGTCGQAERLEPTPLSRTGWRVEAATTVRPGAQPTEFDTLVALSGAYDVVVARSPEGPRGTFQVAGPAGAARIGDTLVFPLRRLYPMEGEWRYGRKATVLPRPPDHPSG